ncbi:unnamed protein product [Staurois parvus]|uniref:Uncharacterized protein n=1 Tax=Staurois parvus TaxID=386267 RepID=A0ABN9G8B3_9NEOB|nr:unnamed protein product [Staurois parvus]
MVGVTSQVQQVAGSAVPRGQAEGWSGTSRGQSRRGSA